MHIPIRSHRAALRPTLFVLVALLAACGTGDPPTVSSFTAEPAAVVLGQRATLSWTVSGATDIDIVAGADRVLVSQAEATGSAMTDLLFMSTDFSLKASNADGSVTRTLTITVEDPGAPVIDRFVASSTTVVFGETVTFEWETSNAASIDLAQVGLTLVSEGPPDGSFTLMPARDTTYRLIALGPADRTVEETIRITVLPAPTPPVIASFIATPNPIDPGQSSVLSWNVMNADEIAVRDPDGAEVYRGPNGMDMATVLPDATTTYTLTAVNAVGATSNSVTVSVNPPVGAFIQAFTANPTNVVLGGGSQLSWTVVNADRIEIAAGGNVLTTSMELTGTFGVLPGRTTEYQLTAFHPEGNATAVVTVSVDPSAPLILNFSATPSPVGLGDSTTLSWSTLGAQRVRILRGSTAIVDTPLETGTRDVPITATSTVFTLEASNATGGNTSQITVYGHPAPTIGELSVSPADFTQSATITVTWSADNVNVIQLFANGVPVPGFPGVSGPGTTSSSGQIDVFVTADTTFRLVATSAAGTVEQSVTVFDIRSETEPNDDATQALALVSGAPADGAIQPSGDVDWYALSVSPGGWVHAETSNGTGGCDMDTVIRLYDTDGTSQLVSDDDGGNGNCSLIDPVDDAEARNLSGGTYFVRVAGFSTRTGSYRLVITTGAPMCGNQLLENGELCDDGNAAPGDGCNASCGLEPIATYTAPGAPLTVTSSIAPVGDQDFYQITVISTVYIAIETFVDSVAGTCPFGNDTFIRLYNGDLTTQIGTDDDDGVGPCSLVSFPRDAWARLDPGVYWLQIEELGNNATIGTYDVVFSSMAADQCGNGFLETGAGETCDDGNLTSGDGCDGQCALEGILENEAGGNDAYDAPGVVTVNMNDIVGGSIVPANDEDWIAVIVPDGYSLEASLTVDSFDSCPVTPEGRLRLYDTDGTSLLADDDNDGPNGNCGRVYYGNDPDTINMAGGTYFLRVTQDASPAQPIAFYYVHIRIIAPGCGNDVLETSIGETCDDNNTSSGDGCDATCTIEPEADYVAPGPPLTVTTSIAVAGEQDYYRITVNQTSYLTVETFVDAAAQSCPTGTDTDIRLFTNDLTLLVRDDDDGVERCSFITFSQDAAARLDPGVYWLRVDEFGNDSTIPRYDIVLRSAVVDVCGNGVVEAGELCDDGNLTSGDGCNASCGFEPIQTYNGPGAPMTYTDAISDPAQLDVFEVVATSSVYVSAETFEDAVAGTCPSVSTVLRLLADDGTELGNDNFDGVGSCSRIDPSDPWSRVGPGTYYLTVEESGRNATIASYDLVLEGAAVDVCGNGILETSIGETCDDGNVVPNDGCSPTCVADPPIPEIEPNGTSTVATPSGVTGIGFKTMQGRIEMGGDLDYYSVVVPAGASLTAFTYIQLGNPTSCQSSTDTRIIVEDSTGTTLANNDDFNGRCSQVDPARHSSLSGLTAGVYYVRAQHFNNSAPAAYDYFMDIVLE